jgi:hypothetical protein
MANAIIYAGIVWEGRVHICQLYDGACRVKQCFRCYNYGHIGTQCDAAQTCGYCAELHETKSCTQKGVKGFTPRYAVCKGAHKTWSNPCPARKKEEMGRAEQAKQFRNIYWLVLSRDDTSRDNNNNTRARERQTRTLATNRAIPVPDTPILEPSQATTISEPTIAQARDASLESQAPPANIETRASVDRSVAEDWATLATQQDRAPIGSNQIEFFISSIRSNFSHV